MSPDNTHISLVEKLSALVDGTISDEEFTKLEQLLLESSDARQIYFEFMQLELDLPELVLASHLTSQLNDHSVSDSFRRPDSTPSGKNRRILATVIAMVLFFTVTLVIRYLDTQSHLVKGQPAIEQPSENVPATTKQVQFTKLAHADFYGELAPELNSEPKHQRDYVLKNGMVQLTFPQGASAIIDGPAVFRVMSNDVLALDLGHCSVHAPPGAEGFRVETPEIDVVDRGTRFSVDVSETAGAEVQVIEGIADIYSRPSNTIGSTNAPMFQRRLTERDAHRFCPTQDSQIQPISFDSSRYQKQLPDRVISYESTLSPEGKSRELVSVTVQRGGQDYQIPVEHLIPANVIWYRAQKGAGCLAGEAELPESRIDLLRDKKLMTGVINPGGSQEPLQSSPVIDPDQMTDEQGTPGMAVKFQTPVANGPGDDIVLFEIQALVNPSEGDRFHVSPLEFQTGLHSLTVERFDLTMESPEAREVDNFSVYMFSPPPESLTALQTDSYKPVAQAIRFHALAVGIDLSDLGYPDGAKVDGIFIQDALDDQHAVDPVFIGGLPELK